MFFTRLITTALVVAAAVPGAAALAAPDATPMVPVAQDLRSPDARPAPPVAQDLRSPDARPAPPVAQDLRSPDAGDAGQGGVASQTTAASAPAGRAVHVSGAEFPWLEVGLSAALTLALIGLGAGTMRRRHRLSESA